MFLIHLIQLYIFHLFLILNSNLQMERNVQKNLMKATITIKLYSPFVDGYIYCMFELL